MKVFEEGETSQNINETSHGTMKKPNRTGLVQILVPKKSSLKYRFGYITILGIYKKFERLKTEDLFFLDFVRWLLEIDPLKRPTAKEALNHPWLTELKYPDGI